MTWIAPNVVRPFPDSASAERESLEQWLAFHRRTLLHKCSGLAADQLKTASVPPSNLTLLGLVRHMAEVERAWFSRFTGTELPDVYCTPEHPDGDFDLIADADPEADFATFHQECALADRTAAGRGLDETFVTSRGRTLNLRWIYTHMIEEYARHNGHADLLRERIDGATGD
jgi:uncharacterized damage-inducible protein DinB